MGERRHRLASAWRLAAVAWLAAGCTDLPPIEPGVCGNGVIEPGEDCDGFAPEGARCTSTDEAPACTFACGDGAACPDGWACGSDARCREPSGSFAEREGAATPLDALRGAAADIDGDGVVDVVGWGTSGVSVLFGDGEGGFGESIDAPLRLAGPAGVGPLTPGGGDEIAANIDVGGLAFEVADGRDPRSVPLSSFERVTAGAPPRITAMETGLPDVDNILIIGDGEMCFITSCELAGGSTSLPPGLDAGDIAARMPVADLDNAPILPFEEVVLGFPGRARIWVYESAVANLPAGIAVVAQQRQIVDLPGPARSEPRLFDLDGDGRLDLLVLAEVAGVDRVVVASGEAGGMFGAAAVDASFDALVPACSSTPWPLAIAELNPGVIGGLVDVVGDTAVCTRSTLAAPAVVAGPSSARPWSEAVVGDFNGDGNADVAAASEDDDTVDILLGNGSASFNRHTAQGRFTLERLRVGDYDGNFIDDLAVVERADLLGGSGQDVSIVFGGSDGPDRATTPMARYGAISDLVPLDFSANANARDVTTDLGVAAEVGSGQNRWVGSALFGNSSRRMVSPAVVSSATVGFVFASAVGRFAEGDAGSMLLFSAQLPGLLDGGSDNPEVDELLLTMVRDDLGTFGIKEQWALVPAEIDFAPACAVYAAADLDGDGTDELVAVNGPGEQFTPFCANDPGRAKAPRVAWFDPTDASPALEVEVVGGELRRPVSIAAHDLDGDGAPELLVVFADGGVAILPVGGGAVDVAAATVLPGIDAPLAATAIEVVPGTPPAIAVLTADELRLYEPDEAGVYTAESRQLVAFGDVVSEPEDVFLAAGQLDGDGLEDLIVYRAGQVRAFLAVPAE